MTHRAFQPVPFTQVTVDDTFWAPRIATTREQTLPAALSRLEQNGYIRNFERAAGRAQGAFEGIFFNDSDVYKVLEGASNFLALNRDPALEARVDALIELIAAAQQPDGYLNTYFTIAEPDKRWQDLRVKHEMYCAGHLIEAAVAHYQATGKRSLLDVACRVADHIGSVFGPGKRFGVPGHEELELALLKLHDVTGEARYLELARFLIDERGYAHDRELYGAYAQDHLPLREQPEVVGHAVRAMYLYTGATDLAAVTGDETLVRAMNRLWADLTLHKLYLTGGIGPSAHNEGFTSFYDLPNDAAYAETCAAIGLIFWSHRMNLLQGDAAFADVLERALYNGFLSSTALDGVHFFYPNPLASRGGYARQEWFGCACCPSNITRFFPTIGGYVYGTTPDAVYVNLYIASSVRVPVGAGLELRQRTRYPWDGRVEITVDPAGGAEFDLALRVPGWCQGATFSVNGAPVVPQTGHGYAHFRRAWRPGDTVVADFPMPVRKTRANPRVRMDVGRVALERGPLVYCLEAVDNGGSVRTVSLPSGAALVAAERPGLLNGVTVLTGTGLRNEACDWHGLLYRDDPPCTQTPLVAVPYYAWNNRGAGEMVVWLPESPGLADIPKAPSLAARSKVSASFVHEQLAALNDQAEPEHSNDHSIPNFNWWNHLGTTEWVQYDFDAPTEVSNVAAYWFDDRDSGGACRVPASWRILYRAGDEWKPVTGASAYGTARDTYNYVSFDAVTTSALRLEATLDQGVSAGLLEWVVNW